MALIGVSSSFRRCSCSRTAGISANRQPLVLELTPDAIRDTPTVAERMNDIPRIGVSTTLTTVRWGPATIINGPDQAGSVGTTTNW